MGMIDIRMLLDRLSGHLQVDPEYMDDVQQIRAESRALGKRCARLGRIRELSRIDAPVPVAKDSVQARGSRLEPDQEVRDHMAPQGPWQQDADDPGAVEPFLRAALLSLHPNH